MLCAEVNMARLCSLCFCVCAVFLCLVTVQDVDALGRRKFGGGFTSWSQPKAPQFKPPPRKHSNPWKTHINQHILNRGTSPVRHTNTAPIGFEHFQKSVSKPQTNSAPIGFENLQNPVHKTQAPIGFESFNKNPHAASAPAMLVPRQNTPYTPSAPAMPVPHQNSPYTPSAPAMPVHHQISPYNPSAPAMPVPHQNSPYNPSAPAMPVPHQNSPYPPRSPAMNIPHQNIPYTPSVPVMPGSHQNIPNAPGMHNTNVGFNPIQGSYYPSNQYTGKVNYPYQTNPNYGWDSHSNTQFKPSNNYPNPGYPNSGYPNTGYPNSGFPSQSFGNNYYNPNTGYPSFPNNYFGGSHYSAPNGYGNSHFGNSYNPHGNNFYPGGGPGYGGYPGQFGYNNYKPKSRFGFGGLPIPIPIPIPIPLGGFGFGGHGSRRNDDYSHHVLNSLQNTTGLNSTSNATSIFVVNNVTVVSCTNELFAYGPVNITVTTCTADNCTSVKVYVASSNSSVNHSTLTMCLGPNMTATSNSSDGVKLEVSNISSYWQMICAVSANTTLNSTASNSTTQNVTNPNPYRNATNDASVAALNMTNPSLYRNATNDASVAALNMTGNVNNSNILCEILSCSYVTMCLPETTRTPCIRVKMCKSPKTPLSHHVTLNTTAIRYDGVNKTESYSLNNITVLAFYPVRNNTNSPRNVTSYVLPLTNITGFPQPNSNTTSRCPGGDGASFCNTAVTSNSNTTSDSDTLELAELKQRIEKLQQLDTELSNRKS